VSPLQTLLPGAGVEHRHAIEMPDGGPPFDAELVEDEFAMLWLHQTNSRGKRIGFEVCSRRCSRSRGAS
jgi:hypothetical protein